MLLLLVACHHAAPASFEPLALSDEGDAAAAHEDPRPLLEHAAAQGTDGLRARAVALLVRYADPLVGARLGLDDDSAWVQRAAVDELASGPAPSAPIRDELLSVVSDPAADPWVRGRAAVVATGEDARSAMTETWKGSTDPWSRLPTALAALELGDETARPALEGSLAAGELPLDLEFLRDLSSRPDEGLARALATAQPKVEPELQLAVAAARVRLGDPSAEQVLRRALSDDDEERRAEVVDLLAELDDPVAVTLLRRAVAQGPDFVTDYAQLALAGRGLAEPSTFARIWEEGDFELRQLAVRYAARAAATGDRRSARKAVDTVLAGLTDGNGSVRAEAARASGELHLQESAPALRALLDDERDTVRVEAAGALLALAAG